MPDLLLELFSEEIPARMQAQGAADLRRLTLAALSEAGLPHESAGAFATPRRLTLHVAGLPARQRDRREERRGPRVGAPEAAVQGFLKSAGLASLDQARIDRDPKGKGEFYVAVMTKPGRPAVEAIAELLPPILRAFPWPKSMRWGPASERGDSLRWVRPLHSIVATFGAETEEPEIVHFSVDGVSAGDLTYGHRFLAPEPIRVRRFEDYVAALERARVVLDPARRRDMIRHDARNLALAQGLELVEDEGLLEEAAGLVEWPVTLMGSFDPAFLEIPEEAIRATIRANQKCFVLRRADGGLADRFILVSNLEAKDGGRAVAEGNARVVQARLSDARFFWRTDLAAPLESRLAKLDAIVFHEKLGTQGERVARLEELARAFASMIDAPLEEAGRAARLAKADLVTEMVGEFPELQGVMGRHYALRQGEPASVADAIRDHYRPQGPSDDVPEEPESIAVALADKIDTLVGFWAAGEKPTGSKDPFGLRRAALGVIRIVLETDHDLCFPLREAFARSRAAWGGKTGADLDEDLLAFFIDRLKVYMREKGASHDLIEAALGARGAGAEGPPDDLRLIALRVEALAKFLKTAEGASLLAGYRRAVSIIAIEEKKDGAGAFSGAFDEALCERYEETVLAAQIRRARVHVASALDNSDFERAMDELAQLRDPVDAFFDKVTVNASDPAIRLNRLRLLNALRDVMHAVADFSKIPR